MALERQEMSTTPSGNVTLFERCNRSLINRAWIVILAWVLLASCALPLASSVTERLVVAGQLRQGQAVEVDRILAGQFNTRSQNALLLVVSGAGSDKWPGSELAEELKSTIDEQGFVTFTSWYSPRTEGRSTAPGQDGLYLVTQVDPALDPISALPHLRELTRSLRQASEEEYAGISMQWTGDAAVREAVVRSSNQDLRRAELRALPLVFILLLIAFRSFIAALLPLLSGGLAIMFSLASVYLISDFLSLSIMAQSVTSLLGLALGIDYSLLMVNRFREARENCNDDETAALVTMRTAGRTIFISGSAVSVGFLGLFVVPVDQMRSIACAGVLVALFSVLLANTLTPVILCRIGPFIDWGRTPGIRNPSAQSRWRRWARFVCKHPGFIAILSALPLILLANVSRQMSGSFPEDSWLPPQTEAVQALNTLQEIDPGNIVQKLNVILELPEGVSVFDKSGSGAVRKLHRHMLKNERSQRIRSILSVTGSNPSRRSWIGRPPGSVISHYVSDDERIALLEFIPYSDLEHQDLSELVNELRALDAVSVTGLDGRILIGGLPAATLDYETVINSWFPRVILLVTLGSFLVLATAFRSLLVPIKAVAMNLLAVFAAYGLLILVFVQGHGIQLVGLSEPVTAVFPATAVIVFCAAFGISMDYEVFLISRMSEARRQGDDTHAIVEGLTLTGGLISSAAAIMITVFGAFALGNILPTQILGFALAAVVALDAVLVRMVLGPAIIKIAGRYNWWPGTAPKASAAR